MYYVQCPRCQFRANDVKDNGLADMIIAAHNLKHATEDFAAWLVRHAGT